MFFVKADRFVLVFENNKKLDFPKCQLTPLGVGDVKVIKADNLIQALTREGSLIFASNIDFAIEQLKELV